MIFLILSSLFPPVPYLSLTQSSLTEASMDKSSRPQIRTRPPWLSSSSHLLRSWVVKFVDLWWCEWILVEIWTSSIKTHNHKTHNHPRPPPQKSHTNPRSPTLLLQPHTQSHHPSAINLKPKKWISAMEAFFRENQKEKKAEGWREVGFGLKSRERERERERMPESLSLAVAVELCGLKLERER